ncbi:VOC family protein [Dokdonella soli]|uniref:VOC domain-containing protein n=1 Tax=Dokdonella soli TaxID=529810 RepID=A0ABN1IYA8_9GAMM
MPRLRSNHYAFPCFDAATTDRFYREVMDFPLVFAMSGPSPEWGGDFLLIGYSVGDGRYLDFFAVRGMRRPPSDGLPDDIRHVAFTTGSVRALEGWKARLAEHGVRYRIEDHGHGDEHLYFADPNGLTLEIAVRSDALPAHSESRTARRALQRWIADS